MLGALAIGTAALLQSASLAIITAAVVATLSISHQLGVRFNVWLQARYARMDPLAIFTPVQFFDWLWGEWGLLLGAPLAATTRTVSVHVGALRPFGNVLAEVAARKVYGVRAEPADWPGAYGRQRISPDGDNGRPREADPSTGSLDG